jgi:hypothetical protein
MFIVLLGFPRLANLDFRVFYLLLVQIEGKEIVIVKGTNGEQGQII